MTFSYETDQQATIRQAVASNPSQNYLISALAGTGKTSTLLAVCPTDAPVLALAFNKRIQEELAGRFPSNAVCKTFNGFGHGVLQKYLGSRPRVQQNKGYQIARGVVEDLGGGHLWKQLADIMTLAQAAKQQGIVPQGASPLPSKPLASDTSSVWQALAEQEDISPDCIEPARQCLIASIQQAFAKTIDFADQLYMPAVFRMPFPRSQYAHIIVDEAQDLGPLEHAMVELTAGGRRPARLLVAGDTRQSIYQWRGALADSMPRLAALSDPPAQELPLTKTFRCPQRVVAEAQRIVPTYEAMPNAPLGEVSSWGSDWTPADLPSNSAILCRTNAPLFRLAMQLIRSRKPCRMLGRDIGAGLKRRIKLLTNNQHTSKHRLAALVEDWRNSETEKALAADDRAKAKKIEDQAASLLAIVDETAGSTQAAQLIGTLFGKDSKGLVLSTIHKAKGLEWPNVFLLDKNKIGTTEEEQNLEYVAITRALETLTYLESQP